MFIFAQSKELTEKDTILKASERPIRNDMKAVVRLFALLALMAVWCEARAAHDALGIEAAHKPASVSQMRLSPDGRFLVALGHAQSKVGVLLIDADSLDSKVIFSGEGAFFVRWVGNDLIALNGARYTLIIDRTGKLLRSLEGRFLRTIRPDPEGHERVLTIGRNFASHIHRVDLRSGEAMLMNFDMPGRPLSWIFDADGVPLVATTMSTAFWSDETTVTHWHRRSIQHAWEPLVEFPWLDVAWRPIYLTSDGRSLVVRSTSERDTAAIYRYSIEERRILEMMAGHPKQDIQFAETDGESEDYRRVATEGMKPEIHWFDAEWANIQRAVDAVLPQRINWLSHRAAHRVLVSSFSDIDPGQWYLLHTGQMSLRKVASAKPEIEPASMLPKRVVSYTSQDGLEIPAYLTLPRDAHGPVPGIVLIHGGPVARDHWQWDAEVQLLASRGYAVLQPQFRGSSGFGKKFEAAGYGQWGLAMQDDVTAGARWMVSQGITEARRMCVFGGSYGGYAAAWALAKTPDLFRCGVSLAGVSDLFNMLKDDSDVNEHATGRIWRQRVVGDPKTQRQRLDDVSPLKKAAAISVPVFIAHGNLDRRVPIDHSLKLVEALKANQKEFEWMELKGEGHGVAKPENQRRFYEALFEFLDRNIGATPVNAGSAGHLNSTLRPLVP